MLEGLRRSLIDLHAEYESKPTAAAVGLTKGAIEKCVSYRDSATDIGFLGEGRVKEPDGIFERLRDDRPTPADVAFLDHKIGAATNRSEAKVLQRVRDRMTAILRTGQGG